jgi:hypothetical protein
MKKNPVPNGFTLVETVMGLLLVGAIMIPLLMTGAKTRAHVIKEATNRRINFEITQVIRNLSNDIRNANTLYLASPASSNSLLGIERYNDAGGNYIQTQWRLTSNVLEYSANGGTTWRSPYPVSAANAYGVTGTFSYCNEANTCSGTPDASTRKIRLNSWTFTSSIGQDPQHFDVPDIYLNLPNRTQANTTTTISSFSTNSGTFPSSGFNVADLTFHPPTKQLVVVGGSDKIYRVNAEGVLIGTVITAAANPATPTLTSIDLEPDGAFAWVVDTANTKLSRINMSTGGVDTSFSYATLGYSNPRGLSYDEGDGSSTFSPLRLVGTFGGVTVIGRLTTAGAISGNTASLATAFVPLAHTPAGVAMDPIAVDSEQFIAGQQVSSGNMTIYRYNPWHIGYSTGSNYSFTLNLSQMGSSDTTTTRNFGLAFDPITNRLFVADPSDSQKRVFQVLPPRTLIRPL